MMGELLYKLRNDEKYNLLYESMPVGGVSGTLRSRFLTTAPQAVGLVRAKTGTLNGTVTLAGYVESIDREYVFVTLADEIPRGARAEKKAREALDRLLGRIAAPNIPLNIRGTARTLIIIKDLNRSTVASNPSSLCWCIKSYTNWLITNLNSLYSFQITCAHLGDGITRKIHDK